MAAPAASRDMSKPNASAAEAPPAIELVGIDKRFGPVHANKEISLSITPGTIHGIVGENGAGKSTLMSILYGFYQADAGEIRVDGIARSIDSPRAAIGAGIGMVHQHFMLVPTFTVLENVMLGDEGGALLNAGRAATRAELERLGRDYGLDVPIDTLVSDLSVGLQQRVEILKALVRGAKILILDEPTGVLTPQETDRLFEILAALRDEGVTIVLITHKLREIMAVTDTVSVMRRGEMVAHRPTSDTNREELAELMVGRKVLLRVDKKAAEPGETLVRVEGLTVRDGGPQATGVDRLSDVNFSIRAGEILGIAGIAGNGQSELLEVLAGIRAPDHGRVVLGSLEITPETPSDPATTREAGVAHVPEDRHRMGLVMSFEAQESAILGYHDRDRYNSGFFQDRSAILAEAAERAEHYDVRPPNPRLRSANFSGGNQQKIVLAREMEALPRILLVGQPTRGVDIGAIEFIHKQIIAMRDAGCAVLLVSVELDEIMSVSDRIAVMAEGKVVGEIEAKDATERALGLMMASVPLDLVAPDERDNGSNGEGGA